MEPELLTGGQLAELLSCSRPTAYRLMREGHLPGVVHLPGTVCVRINRQIIMDWIAEKSRPSRDPNIEGVRPPVLLRRAS